jgi:hypothetical protein
VVAPAWMIACARARLRLVGSTHTSLNGIAVEVYRVKEASA